jgi:hypothetical protein
MKMKHILLALSLMTSLFASTCYAELAPEFKRLGTYDMMNIEPTYPELLAIAKEFNVKDPLYWADVMKNTQNDPNVLKAKANSIKAHQENNSVIMKTIKKSARSTSATTKLLGKEIELVMKNYDVAIAKRDPIQFEATQEKTRQLMSALAGRIDAEAFVDKINDELPPAQSKELATIRASIMKTIGEFNKTQADKAFDSSGFMEKLLNEKVNPYINKVNAELTAGDDSTQSVDSDSGLNSKSKSNLD